MKKLLLLLALSTFATSVLADKDQNAFYGDAIFGQAKQGPDITSGKKVMDDEFSMGARVGYQFHPYIAIEAAYHDYGELYDANTQPIEGNENDTKLIRDYFQAKALNLGVKFIIHCSDCDLTLDLRWGAAKWDFDAQKLDSSNPGTVQNLSDNDVNRYYGAGTTYHVSDNMTVGLEWTVTAIKLFDGNDFIDQDQSPRPFRIRQLALAFGWRL